MTGTALHPTPNRMLFLASVARSEVYREAGQVWNATTGFKVTEVAMLTCQAGWVEDGGSPWAGRTSLRLTDTGHQVHADNTTQDGDTR